MTLWWAALTWLWSMISTGVQAWAPARASTSRAKGAITASVSMSGLPSSRLIHWSRMSNRSAARGRAAASSIRLTSRTSKAVATRRAKPSRCFLFCRGKRAAKSAPIAAATVSIPPIPGLSRLTAHPLQSHQAARTPGNLIGGKQQVRPNLALTKALWQKPACHLARLSSRERLGACCRSSVVEHSLGKGEVESSILSCSTSLFKGFLALRLRSLARN